MFSFVDVVPVGQGSDWRGEQAARSSPDPVPRQGQWCGRGWTGTRAVAD